MEPLTQKSLEMFFDEYGIVDPTKKACLLPLLTPLVYNYNMDVVRFEGEGDVYKQKQLQTSIEELSQKIKEVMEETPC
jgi:hypothetical protein